MMLNVSLHWNWAPELRLTVLPFAEMIRDRANGWKMMNPKMDADRYPTYETDAHHLDLKHQNEKQNTYIEIAVFKI